MDEESAFLRAMARLRKEKVDNLEADLVMIAARIKGLLPNELGDLPLHRVLMLASVLLQGIVESAEKLGKD